MTIEILFYELIQVALGVRACVSHTPSTEEWKLLYEMARKQSLVGVCFAGVQKLQMQRQELPEMQYLTWLGLAIKIQYRNEVLDKQCAELQARLSADGINSSILKGQTIAYQYAGLAGLRQSGDIDILVDCDRKKMIDYVLEKGMKIVRWDYKHLDVKAFYDTEVEFHYRPGISFNFFRNNKLQKFWRENNDEFYMGKMSIANGSITVPSSRMQTFYILHHAYRHFVSGGIGFRQVMDLYFILLNRNRGDDEWLKMQVSSFGMKKFAEAISWVICDTFGMSMLKSPWIPNEREGRFILKEIMIGGCFGKQADCCTITGSHVRLLANISRRQQTLAMHYGSEILLAPLYYIWHFFWKRMNK